MDDHEPWYVHLIAAGIVGVLAWYIFLPIGDWTAQRVGDLLGLQ